MNTTRPWTISTSLLATLRSLVDDLDTVHAQDNGDYVAYFRAISEADHTESIVLKIRIEPRLVRKDRELVECGLCMAIDSTLSPPTRNFSGYLAAYSRASKFVVTVLERGIAVEGGMYAP